ncbi:MAG: thiamine pyrophosphate-binding protein [Oscillospiraceae bacterium]|nr:thiamine pyrophosphate-binding protein [Oscillospiraceae bacterium]
MKLSDYVISTIKAAGVDTVFGFQGSNATHLINSIHTTPGIEYHQNNHEQASAFAACGYSEVKGMLGCAISSSGPGAINLIGGMVNAWFDSLPVIFLTGQLNSKALSPSINYRQHGFQEFDIVSVASNFTKYAVTVLDATQIRYHLEKAIWLATNGRQGGVLLDIPHDIQACDIDIKALNRFDPEETDLVLPEPTDIADCLNLLASAKRPLVLVGGGAKELRNNSLFDTFISEFNLPTVASLRGLDLLSHDSTHFYGFIGAYGNRYANLAIHDCDLLLVLGSRLDPLQIGNIPDGFGENAKIIHVDIDRYELNHNIRCDVAINSSCQKFIEALFEQRQHSLEPKNYREWYLHLDQLKRRYPVFSNVDDKTLPNQIIYSVSRFFAADDIITGDVGQNQMWTAQSIYLRDNMRLLNSGGLGSMGYSLPAAIGAAMANPVSRVLSISGDGGIQMNIQELATVKRLNLPIKIMIMNNQSLGLIRTYQNIVFNNNIGSVEGFSSPDYELIAKGYGIRYLSVGSVEELQTAESLLTDLLPLVIEVKLPIDTEVHPEPAYRMPVYIQSPLVD